jgi:hypothetical protein
MLSVLAFVAGASATSSGAEYCVLETDGHPTVDLTPLSLIDQDYSVGSHVNSNFDFVINVCSDLNYQDDTCHEGSSVCQRHKKTEAATDVYGYTGSIKMSWDDPDGKYTANSTVVMKMTGTACSATSNTTESETTVVFVCSNKEFLMLESENPDKCTASFLFFTAQACGTPRYTCFNGTKCIEATNTTASEFSTYDKCAASCGVAPTKYACVEDADVGFQCVEKPDGDFTDFAECNTDCATSHKNKSERK